MIDPNVILPLLQAMGKGDKSNMSQIEPLLSMMNNKKSPEGTPAQGATGGSQNNMMQMLPMLMQMMNKGANNTPTSEQPTAEEETSDPFEPIRNIGNDSINSMLFNLMNRK